LDAVVLASGPSLGFDNYRDVKTIADKDCLIIAVNSTIFDAPFADICFGMDQGWWQHNHKAVKKLPCRRVSSNTAASKWGCEIIPVKDPKHSDGCNSGCKAIQLAAREGAREIVLLGFDCQHTGGKAHHHKDHGHDMSNANRTDTWRTHFAMLANALKGRVNVINCSQETALTCFPRMTLEVYLGGR